MLKKLSLLLITLSLSQFACAEKISATIPLGINHVQTKRVSDSVIRIIKYNMEIVPRLVIERLETPKYKLAEKLVIEKVTLGNKLINFKDSAGTYVDNMSFKKGVFHFTVEHYFGGTSGGEIMLKCKVDVKNNKIKSPICVRK